ncbi:MAG: transcription termination factor Rho [Syntrophaceae bacterium]
MSHHKEEKPLEKMTVPELKEFALTFPHEHLEKAVHDMHKDELLAFIKQAQGIQEPGAPKKNKAHVHAKVKVPLSKAELKARIVALKSTRQSAREADDRKLSARLRRRISRLKKLTRKIA